MDTTALRQRLDDILREEERSDVDWGAVERMCEKLDEDLDGQPELDCPHIVFHFLSDADIRAKEPGWVSIGVGHAGNFAHEAAEHQ
jgi:hypothetical protein